MFMELSLEVSLSILMTDSTIRQCLHLLESGDILIMYISLVKDGQQTFQVGLVENFFVRPFFLLSARKVPLRENLSGRILKKRKWPRREEIMAEPRRIMDMPESYDV